MITNTAAFAQYRRNYAATVTGANTNYTTPTNTALLAVAGPDGSLITRLASLPRSTVGQTQMQFFLTKDAGTTYNLLQTASLPAYSLTQSTQITGIASTQIDGTVLSETNPLPLGGQNGFNSTTPTFCGTASGSANAQLLPFANVSALTARSVYDFEAGLTNTAGTTIQIGSTVATPVVRDITGAALSAGDITAGFRYRVWYDGSNLRLVITDRVYVAAAIALAGGITTTAQIADF